MPPGAAMPPGPPLGAVPPPPPGSEVGDHYAHSRQNSDPYSAGLHSPMSPYYYNPYFDHMRCLTLSVFVTLSNKNQYPILKIFIHN